MQDDAPTILVVDDQPEIRALIAQLMRREGYRIVECENGRQALESILRQRPDLVISDIMMPALDGFGLVSEVRRKPDLADLPILLISAKETSDDVLSGLVLGANDYLIKPFDLDVLLAKIRLQLALQHRHRSERLRVRRMEEALRAVEEEVESLVRGLTFLAEERPAEAHECLLRVKGRLEDILAQVAESGPPQSHSQI